MALGTWLLFFRKLDLIISAVLGVAAAALGPSAYPEQSNKKNVRILTLDSNVNAESFRYNYETENGIKAEKKGREADGIEAQGNYQYTGDDGQVYSVSYAAGQGGFLPQGAHLPTAPPIPEEIIQALEYNARHEAAGIMDDGQYYPDKYGGQAASEGFGQQNNRAQAATSAGFRQKNKF